MLVGAYLKHLLLGVGPHGVHSPFVFNLITEVLVRKQNRTIWNEIENVRRSYLQNNTPYRSSDFGAGSKRLKEFRTISKSVSSASMPKWKGEVLHLLIEHMNPSTVLELGTHFGIGSLYLATALNNRASLMTIEADATHLAYAENTFQLFKQISIQQIQGTFDEKLNHVLTKLTDRTIVFIDGNHTEEATLNYFEKIAERDEVVAIIFDDIYWSAGMKRAWQRICEDAKVQLSLDFFWFGVVFLHGRMQKEHFVLRWPR